MKNRCLNIYKKNCSINIPNLLLLFCTITLISCASGITTAAAQILDIGDWEVVQANSAKTYVIPTGTTLNPGDYLILGRYASRSEFEAYYGVVLGGNVVYLTNEVASSAVPMINGDETYSLYNSSALLLDGPTPEFSTSVSSHHRTDPEAAPWNLDNNSPTPATGVEAADGIYSGLVISEATNPSDYYYEYVELYYDADDGGSTNILPVITNVNHSPTSPEAGDDITITATITDEDGTVNQARVYYRFDDASFSYMLASNSGDTYSVVIPNVSGGNTMEYYVWCNDNVGSSSVSPLSAPTSLYSVWIEGVISPIRVIVFDHAHDQDAGSAGNWRIDNNYPNPSPTIPTSESSWSGQLSSWAYELYLLGHTVRSNTSTISAATFNGVDLYVIPEPQNPFTAAEIEAVRQYVYNGGSLFFITDHNSSDRNNNGWDSPSIFGGYSMPHITTPIGSDSDTFCGALFGLHIHVKDESENSISGSHTNINSDPENPIIHGSYGDVSEIYYHVGNVMTLWPSANVHLSNVGGLVSRYDGSPHLAAWSEYGSGRVVGYGDSSSMADGTGSESHTNNWIEANHREFFLNATLWLLSSPPTAVEETPVVMGLPLQTWPNPFNPRINIQFELPNDVNLSLEIFDLAGQRVKTLINEYVDAGPHTISWDGHNNQGRQMPSGVYFVRANNGTVVSNKKIVLAK